MDENFKRKYSIPQIQKYFHNLLLHAYDYVNKNPEKYKSSEKTEEVCKIFKFWLFNVQNWGVQEILLRTKEMENVLALFSPLQDIIDIVLKTHLFSLALNRTGNTNNVQYKSVPQAMFVHKTYIFCAKYAYERTYLFLTYENSFTNEKYKNQVKSDFR